MTLSHSQGPPPGRDLGDVSVETPREVSWFGTWPVSPLVGPFPRTLIDILVDIDMLSPADGLLHERSDTAYDLRSGLTAFLLFFPTTYAKPVSR